MSSSIGSRSLSSWIVQNNPVYLISAVCMLGSCVVLANSSSHQNIPLSQLLLLSGTLLAYQVALFGMGAFLSLKRGVLRDGKTLLLLDAIFLTDITFVNTELLTSDLSAGLWLGIPLLLLAAWRIWWIGKRLLETFEVHRYIFAVLMLAMVLAFPALLKYFDNGTSITAVTFYGLWWLAGLTVAAAVIVDHARGTQAAPARLRWVQSAYLIAPFASLILHLAILHYVYDVHFYSAMLTPVLLGLIMALHYTRKTSDIKLRLVVLFVALVWGLWGPSELNFSFGEMAITPVRLTLAAVYATVVYLFLVRYAFRLLVAGAIAGGLVVAAPTLGSIAGKIGVALKASASFAGGLLPSSRTGWGIIGIIASFLLLGLGAMISLRKAPEQPQADDAPQPPPVTDELPPAPPEKSPDDAEVKIEIS